MVKIFELCSQFCYDKGLSKTKFSNFYRVLPGAGLSRIPNPVNGKI